jgi:hypothetical protein
VLCAFIVGIFAGIWLDSSAWKEKIADRNLVFEVQDYQMANLQVHPGDTISLAIPKGGNGGAAINWIGNDPCVNGGTGSSCTIGSTAPTGPYFFNCASQNYSCPEPGVQQGPAPPGLRTSYGEMVVKDFAYLFGISGHHHPHAPQPPSAAPGAGPANNSITAIASCVGGVPRLQDPNGGDRTLITAPVGQTVYWIDPNGFSLNLSSAPAGLCAGGNPGTGNATTAKCTIAPPAGPDVHYTITPQGSPACSPLPAELKTTAPQPAPGGSH